MLNNLSEQIRECLEHAEDCARKAAEQPNGSRLKQDFLNLEKRWLELSRSFQLGERLTDFTNEANRKVSAPITPFLQGQAFDPETVQAMTNALDVRDARIERPGRRHDPTSCRKDHRIGKARSQNSDRVAFGRDQGIWVISPLLPAAFCGRQILMPLKKAYVQNAGAPPMR